MKKHSVTSSKRLEISQYLQNWDITLDFLVFYKNNAAFRW